MSPLRILGLVIWLSYSHPVAESLTGYFIWNVGQGQWITYLDEQGCLHFDMGGEGPPPKGPFQICKRKPNQLFLTHFDWDHIKYVTDFQATIPNFCWWPFPAELIPENKRAISKKWRVCQEPSASQNISGYHAHAAFAKSHNDQGRVYLVNAFLLIPGDQSKQLEGLWVKPATQKLKTPGIVMLPHHGSKNSSSERLLNDKRFYLGVASARRARYGHPHSQLKKRVSEAGMALMTTEVFGSIFIPAETGFLFEDP